MSLPLKAPLPPAPTWTGCYLDAGVGYGNVESGQPLGNVSSPLPIGTTVTMAAEVGWAGSAAAGITSSV